MRRVILPFLITIAALVLVVGLGLSTRSLAGPLAQPEIPHVIEGREACLVCHETGVAGAPKAPDDHAGRGNDICQLCHKPAPVEAAPEIELEPTVTPTSLLEPTATPPAELEPTATPSPQSKEPTATPAPAGPPHIPHSLTGRDNCLACHGTGVGGAPMVPDDHTGRTSEVCRSCHEPAEAVPQVPSAPTATREPVPTPIKYPKVAGLNTCLECHRGLGGRHEQITSGWEGSIHAARGVACADCHGGDPSATSVDGAMSPQAGYIGAPARQDIPALCASCHADVEQMRQYDLPTDQYRKYRESIHGLRLAEGDLNVATCFDCHDGHSTRETNDPAASVYPLNVPGLCASCHADAELMRPYGIPTNQYELYVESVHGIALLEQQDLRAPSCATCHGTHGAAPPGFQEVANVCGGCHTATQDYYLKSPHARGTSGTPKCVTCHGRYDVSVPGEEMFLGQQPRHCGSCHGPASAVRVTIDALHRSLSGGEVAFEEAEQAVAQAASRGMIMSPQEARLREARTDLITARAAQHTVQLSVVEERTGQSKATSEEVKESAESAIAESIFRRQAMVVAVAAISLTVVALYAVKRELYREL